jgi:hypothetical protein
VPNNPQDREPEVMKTVERETSLCKRTYGDFQQSNKHFSGSSIRDNKLVHSGPENTTLCSRNLFTDKDHHHSAHDNHANGGISETDSLLDSQISNWEDTFNK